MAGKLRILLHFATAALISTVMLAVVTQENFYLALKTELRSLIGGEGTLEIYSLDPYDVRGEENNSDFFRGRRILGSAHVENLDERKRLLTSFFRDIPSYDPHWMTMCFNPRHGIRLKGRDRVIDFLVCFSCARTDCYGLEKFDFFTHGSRSEPELDTFLTRNNVQLAPKDQPSEATSSNRDGSEIVEVDEFGLPQEPTARPK